MLAKRDPARVSALHGNEPQVRFVPVLLRIDGAHLVDDAASVGRDRDGVDELKLEQILGRDLLSLRHEVSPFSIWSRS